MMNEFTSMAEEAIGLYQSAVTKKIESMPEFKTLCEDELAKVLAAFPEEVAAHVNKMKASNAFEYMEWSSNDS